MTGRISIDLFLTLDGVGQAPGGPDEDPSGGFAWGGWQAPFEDEVVGAAVLERIAGIDALLLGRRTYDIFAAYWPHHPDVIGRHLNAVPKYVASRSPRTLEWEGAVQLGADVAAEAAALRDRHERVHVIGSLDLVRTLLAARAFDELALWVYPVVLGQGRRAFPEGVAPTGLTPLGPPLAGPTGAVLLRYGPGADPTTGRIGSGDD